MPADRIGMRDARDHSAEVPARRRTRSPSGSAWPARRCERRCSGLRQSVRPARTTEAQAGPTLMPSSRSCALRTRSATQPHKAAP
jgi:hypothetical protein